MSATLQQALEAHAFSLPAEQVELLERYCQVLWDWNSRLNLTRHTDYEKFVARDIRDTQQLAAVLREGEEVLDIGSGGGVPGIVLAILRPDLQVSLSESVGKKAAALEQMVEELELPVAVHAARAEDVLEDLRFDSLVARAVGPLDKLLTCLRKRWSSFQRLVAIKGPSWPEEKSEAARRGLLHGLEIHPLATYPLEGTGAESCLLEVRLANRGVVGGVEEG